MLMFASIASDAVGGTAMANSVLALSLPALSCIALVTCPTKRSPPRSSSAPPAPLTISAQRMRVLCSSFAGLTPSGASVKPVGWTWIMSRSTAAAPAARAREMPSPVVVGLFVEARCTNEGATREKSESGEEKGYPNPPVQITTAGTTRVWTVSSVEFEKTRDQEEAASPSPPPLGSSRVQWPSPPS